MDSSPHLYNYAKGAHSEMTREGFLQRDSLKCRATDELKVLVGSENRLWSLL